MVWPDPSVSPFRLIETPPAWPVITTWKASNSFLAAAIFAPRLRPPAAAPRGGSSLLPARPNLGGGCGTGGEQSDEQGEHLHG